MLRIQYIRSNHEEVQKKSKQKGFDVDIDALLVVDASRKELLLQIEKLRQERNENAARMKGGKPDQATIEEGKRLKEQLAQLEPQLESQTQEWYKLLKQVPNMPLDDVPIGSSEDENVVVYEKGDKPVFNFEPKNHADIAIAKGWLDKERAAKVAGSRFAYIKGDMALLEFALINWISVTLGKSEILRQIADDAGLNSVSDKPFIPVLPPLMIKTKPYDDMDRLEPRDDRYKIEGEELWLQGSAEHVLGSMYADEFLDEKELPLRMLGFASSFRKEAGTYGKDMEGIIRMHQFDKLEMESFTSEKDGLNEHLFLIAVQEYILSQLGIPYRKLLKCTYDIGKPNARGVDMDAWLPGQGKYRETHTADYMTDYQALRLNTRYFIAAPEVSAQGDAIESGNAGSYFVHTNDATALALGRGMVAIIENYQTVDGDVIIPQVLRQYMGGREKL